MLRRVRSSRAVRFHSRRRRWRIRDALRLATKCRAGPWTCPGQKAPRNWRSWLSLASGGSRRRCSGGSTDIWISSNPFAFATGVRFQGSFFGIALRQPVSPQQRQDAWQAPAQQAWQGYVPGQAAQHQDPRQAPAQHDRQRYVPEQAAQQQDPWQAPAQQAWQGYVPGQAASSNAGDFDAPSRPPPPPPPPPPPTRPPPPVPDECGTLGS